MLPARTSARGRKARATLASAVVTAIATSIILGSPLSFATGSIFAKLSKSTDAKKDIRGKGLARAIRVDAEASTPSPTTLAAVTDRTPPQTTITRGPATSTIASTATFAFVSSEANSTFECKLDAGAWARCASPRTYSGVGTGNHLFRVRAIDAAKNVDPTPARRRWTVEAATTPDTTPPQTTIVSGPSAKTTSTAASFAFSSSESNSSFECKLDSGSWSACTTPKSYSSLATGSHQFSVRAIDAAKNVDTTPATQSWTVEAATPADTTPPQTSITSGPASKTTSTSASFAFSSSEPGSTFECKLDAGAWAACTSPKPYTGLSASGHQFSVRAIDAARNTDTTPATQSWTVEKAVSQQPGTTCTTTVSSTSAVSSAVTSASSGAVICLANGSYGKLTLSASKAKPGVVVRAQNPGQATIDGASMSGSYLTLARFNVTDEVTVQPGATGMTVDHNHITGGYMGVNAGPTSSTQINDTRITNNQLVGPFGEDAIRLNRYHDSDGDGIGVLIEGNEITGVRENGNHSDCLQAVWTGDHIVYRRNYLHDNRCQGFFIKDQASLGGVSGPISGIAVEDNLFVRDNEPCAPEAPGCGQPSYFQVFGPYSGFVMRRNTFWGGDQVAVFQEGTGSDSKIENNVIYRLWTNTNMSVATYANNTRCKRETSEGGSWPASTPGETVTCSPAFNNAAVDDLRLIGSDRGVDWAPAEQHYGP